MNADIGRNNTDNPKNKWLEYLKNSSGESNSLKLKSITITNLLIFTAVLSVTLLIGYS